MSDTGRLSVLGELSKRREEIKNEQLLSLPVPRWENPTVWVRFEPVDHKAIRRAAESIDKAPKQRRGEVELEQNMDTLIRACVGVYAKLDGDDREYSLRPDDFEGELTRFDQDLAANLGLPSDATARQVVKALYLTDGDILSHAMKLVEWSGYRETEADEAMGES